MSREKPPTKDKLVVYNTGIEVLVAGAIVFIIGMMFHYLGANIASRTPGARDLPNWMQHIAWVFWLAPVCYLASVLILGVGAFLVYRAYRQVHPSDRRQTRLTSYQQ